MAATTSEAVAEAITAPAYRKASRRWTDFAAAMTAAQPKMDPSDVFKRGNVLEVRDFEDLQTGEVWVHGLYGLLVDSMEKLLQKKNRWGRPMYKNFHLIGPAGTGKTTFETVLIYYLAQKKCKVILRFKDQESWVYFDFSSSVPRVLLADRYNAYENLVDKESWLIVDGPSKYIAHPGPVLQCVSDAKSNHHEFAKQGPGMYLYMEAWSLQDCVDCATALQLEINDMPSRYYYCGGIPRLIFFHGPEELKDIMDSTFANVSRASFEHIMKNPGAENTESDKLFHYRYPATFLATSSGNIPNARRLVPASQYVLLKADELYKLDDDRRRKRWLKESSNVPEAAGFRGIRFEECAHREIGNGGRFRLKELKHQGAETQLDLRPMFVYTVYEWELYSSATTSLLNIEAQQKWQWEKLQPNTYVRAVARNQKSWDGFYVGACSLSSRIVVKIFQMTVSVDHPVKWDAIQELEARIKEWGEGKYTIDYEMVFVVPSDIYGSFPRQEFLEKEGRHVYKRVPAAVKTLQQYALKIAL